MAQKKSNPLSLEEKLLNNAVDTVVKNMDAYDAPVLIHLAQEMLTRKDLAPSFFRIFSQLLTAQEMKDLGVHGGMAGTGDDAMNYLTMPSLHRTLLRGVQQMQEHLMPGGFIRQSKDLDIGDATRMLRDCTTQLEKVLRLTKAAKANAEILRLKEAVAAGLGKISKELGPDVQARALQIFNAEVRNHLSGTEVELNQVMEEAERLGG